MARLTGQDTDSRDGLIALVQPCLLPMLLIVAFVHLFLVDVASILPYTEVSDDLIARQRRLSAPLNTLALLAAGLFLAASLTHLALNLTASRRPLSDRILIVGGLIVLGTAALRAAQAGPNMLKIQLLLLAASIGLTAVRVATSDQSLRTRIIVGASLISFVFPLAWRFMFDHESGGVGDLSATLRWIGDAAIPIGLAATIFLPRTGSPPSIRLAMTAVFSGSLALTLLAETEVREVVIRGTDLWLTALPWWAIAPILSLAIAAAIRAALDMSGSRYAGLGAGIVLVGCAGFLPTRNPEVVMAFCGHVLIARWAAGDAADWRRLQRL